MAGLVDVRHIAELVDDFLEEDIAKGIIGMLAGRPCRPAARVAVAAAEGLADLAETATDRLAEALDIDTGDGHSLLLMPSQGLTEQQYKRLRALLIELDVEEDDELPDYARVKSIEIFVEHDGKQPHS